MRKQIYITLVVLILINIIAVIAVRADSWAPSEPFYVISDDGERIFHVTPDFWPDWVDWGNQEDFPPTGLYYNTNPPELIYLVENPGVILLERDFIFSHDMQYFVWIPSANMSAWHNRPVGIDRPPDSCWWSGALALVFYDNGSVIKEYIVADLLMRNLNTGSTSMAMWIDWDMAEARRRVEFDSRRNGLTVTTVEHLTYIFDITTGEIVVDVLQTGVTTAVIIGVGIAGVILFLFYRRVQNKIKINHKI